MICGGDPQQPKPALGSILTRLELPLDVIGASAVTRAVSSLAKQVMPCAADAPAHAAWSCCCLFVLGRADGVLGRGDAGAKLGVACCTLPAPARAAATGETRR